MKRLSICRVRGIHLPTLPWRRVRGSARVVAPRFRRGRVGEALPALSGTGPRRLWCTGLYARTWRCEPPLCLMASASVVTRQCEQRGEVDEQRPDPYAALAPRARAWTAAPTGPPLRTVR